MPGYTQLYNKQSEFYSTVVENGGYNPETTVYYDSAGNVVRIQETWRGSSWAKTISGSNYSQQWPDYTNYEVISSWSPTAVSG